MSARIGATAAFVIAAGWIVLGVWVATSVNLLLGVAEVALGIAHAIVGFRARAKDRSGTN